MLKHPVRLVVICLLAPCAFAQSSFSIDPRGTYLRTSQDAPQAPLIVSLTAIGLSPGDRIRIEALGDFDCGGPCGDDRLGLIAVFSATSQLLPQDQPHRVPGAIDAGVDAATLPTYHGGLPTDIAEDFWIRDSAAVSYALCLRVPDGAEFLFLSTPDHLFYDNSDPDGDYGVRLTALPPCDGDVNQDCTVGQADLGIVLANWEQSVPPGTLGDVNADGVVDQSDLGVVLAEYGLSCP
jgi:hypothetical protein